MNPSFHWIYVEGLTNPFYISDKPITYGQYDLFCDATGYDRPADVFGRDQQPVINVNIPDALAYYLWLSNLSGETIRLPNEQEWEYAARGGIHSQGFEYSGSNSIDDIAWYGWNSSDKIHDVGTKQPNELGLYDMSGNIWEWVGTDGQLCGGAYDMDKIDCSVKYHIRGHNDPNSRCNAVGFRIVQEI